MRRLCVSFVLTLAAGPAVAQSGVDYYEARFGPIADVSLADLVQESSLYEGRGVRTSGRLQPAQGLGDRSWRLSGTFGAVVQITPFGEIATQFEAEARRSMGRQVQITGVFYSNRGTGYSSSAGVIRFWSFQGPPEEASEDGPQGTPVSLESLVARPGNNDGQLIRVVGKFRGRNLYGDLPVRSQRKSDDWVIKDELFAVWVTGRKPEGDGFDLDASLKRDTNKWLEVLGTPETRNGVTYLKARRVALAKPPAEASVAPPPPPPEIPKVPPVVVFALPLDGEVVPRQAEFLVQFSKDMVESSFDGRVELRYVGPTRPGDRPFDGVSLSYDGGHRALRVDPGDVLRPGRLLELVLHQGIEDIDGLTLQPRPGVEPDATGVADVLRYRVGS